MEVAAPVGAWGDGGGTPPTKSPAVAAVKESLAIEAKALFTSLRQLHELMSGPRGSELSPKGEVRTSLHAACHHPPSPMRLVLQPIELTLRVYICLYSSFQRTLHTQMNCSLFPLGVSACPQLQRVIPKDQTTQRTTPSRCRWMGNPWLLPRLGRSWEVPSRICLLRSSSLSSPEAM